MVFHVSFHSRTFTQRCQKLNPDILQVMPLTYEHTNLTFDCIRHWATQRRISGSACSHRLPPENLPLELPRFESGVFYTLCRYAPSGLVVVMNLWRCEEGTECVPNALSWPKVPTSGSFNCFPRDAVQNGTRVLSLAMK